MVLPILLVAGTRFGADLMHVPVIASHWMYVTTKQGARKMKRVSYSSICSDIESR